MKKQEIASKLEIDHFDDLADDYKKTHDDALKIAGGDSDYFYQMKLNIIDESIESTPKKILDYGCGTGRLAILLSKKYPNSQIVGFDPSPESINVANGERLKNAIFTTNIEDLDITDFDLVVSAGVFHHIPPELWEENLKIIKDHMSVSGKLFIFEHNPFSVLTQLLLWWAGNDKDATLVRPYKFQKMINKIFGSGAGLKFISFFPPYLKPFLSLEKYLTKIPFGAQHYIEAIKNGDVQ